MYWSGCNRKDKKEVYKILKIYFLRRMYIYEYTVNTHYSQHLYVVF